MQQKRGYPRRTVLEFCLGCQIEYTTLTNCYEHGKITIARRYYLAYLKYMDEIKIFTRDSIDHGISRPAGLLAYGQEGMQLCRYYTTLPKKGNVCPTMAAIPKG